MADNVAITAGSGTTIAADDIGGVLHQRVKISQGADGSATDVSSAAPLQVTLANSAAIPAGTNAIGKLAANSGVDIGDVDVTSIAAGNNVIGQVKLTDGTNVLSMVDAAVSAAAFALPVALHPDSVEYGKTVVKSLTMSTDTSAYASGDLIADTQQLDAALRVTDGKGILQSLTIIDEDAQGVAFYVLVMRTSTSLGSENSAPNITDANLTAGLLGIIPVSASDYITCSGAKIANIRNIGMPIQAVSGTDDIYIAVLNGTGTPTYTASGLEFVFGIQQD